MRSCGHRGKEERSESGQGAVSVKGDTGSSGGGQRKMCSSGAVGSSVWCHGKHSGASRGALLLLQPLLAALITADNV